jgi:hypothetical protein
MKMYKIALSSSVLGIFVLLSALVGAMAQEGLPVGGVAHANQIWGSVVTRERSTENIFDKDITISIHMYHKSRIGKTVAVGKVKNTHYTVDLGDLPAGKYVARVNTGGSEYGGGERVIHYFGPGSSVNQNWTLSIGHPAIPGEE